MVIAPRTDPAAISNIQEVSRLLRQESFLTIQSSKALVATSRRLLDGLRAGQAPRCQLCRVALLDLDANTVEVFGKTYSREEAERVCAQMNEYYGDMFGFAVMSAAPNAPKWFVTEGWCPSGVPRTP